MSDDDADVDAGDEEDLKSFGMIVNFLGKKFGRSKTTTNIQNHIRGVNGLLDTVRNLFNWHSKPTTAGVLVALVALLALQCLVPFRYIFATLVVFIFSVSTHAWACLMRFITGTIAGICMLLDKRRQSHFLERKSKIEAKRRMKALSQVTSVASWQQQKTGKRDD